MSQELPSPLETAPSASPATQPRRTHVMREIVETVLLTVAIFLVVNAATGRFRIEGSSMEPNLHNGEYVLIDKVSYLVHQPERGDVVVFTPPTNEQKDYIKRVIGLPGDTVEIKSGHVYVNGVALDEPYLTGLTNSNNQVYHVDEGHYFVLGDNRNNSSDSRSFGTITPQSIVGRAWLVYWPPSDWSTVPHHTYAALSAP
ncbi:MAG TPA: signal peptidase I [Anaerolineae bacterium]|nr:signal peptidase I [Anaerolineae bacterium]